MSQGPRFFEQTLKMKGEGPHEAVFSTPVPHWVLWGQQVNYYMIVDAELSRDRLTSFRIFVRLTRNRVGAHEHAFGLTSSEIAASGDSYYDAKLLASSPLKVNVQERDIILNSIVNAQDRLAGFESEDIQNITLDGAVSYARAAANLFAVSLSAATNIPCIFDIIQVRSADTQLQYSRVTLPYPEAVLQIASYQSISALEPFITVYAEGLREQSVFYRFLCFFKVVDKLLSSVLPQLRKLGEMYSVAGPNFSGTIPSDPFDKVAPDYVGKKYTAVRDSLQERYRNVIAHLDVSSPIRPFDVSSEGDVGAASRVMAYVAHDLLYRTYEYIRALDAAGYGVASLSMS
jgi:hypothetical protein